MKTGKVIISLFLLLTYVIGYAHSLLPHHADTEAVEQSSMNIDGKHHHHNHMQASPSENSKNNRLIEHEHHYDDGLFDLIVCLINEVEHQENDCNFDFYDLANPIAIENKANSKHNPVKARFVAVFVAVLNLSIQNNKPATINPEFTIVYNAPPITQSPNRGPPTLA